MVISIVEGVQTNHPTFFHMHPRGGTPGTSRVTAALPRHSLLFPFSDVDQPPTRMQSMQRVQDIGRTRSRRNGAAHQVSWAFAPCSSLAFQHVPILVACRYSMRVRKDTWQVFLVCRMRHSWRFANRVKQNRAQRPWLGM